MGENLFLHKALQWEPAEMPVCPLIVELGAGFGGYWCCRPEGCVRSRVSLPSIGMPWKSDICLTGLRPCDSSFWQL